MQFEDTNKSGSGKLVTVFGGSGFVGRHVVRQLAKRGYHIRVAVRRPDLAFHLQPLGNVGQIKFVQANLRNEASVANAAAGSNVIVNLVGILEESGKQKFDAIQEVGAAKVALAAKKYGASLVHVSAIGADSNSRSQYARTKAAGESAVVENCPKAIIMRPSIIFGSDDGFFNRFGEMAKISPFLPLIGGGKTLFQPVFVGDVANAVANAVDGKLAPGKTYELGGPQVLSFRECLELLGEVTGRSRSFINLPFWFAKLMARLTGWLPFAPLQLDQVYLLEADNVVSEKAKAAKLDLQGCGVTPTTLAAILPTYLVKFRPHGQFSKINE